jgi:hypothetical protein
MSNDYKENRNKLADLVKNTPAKIPMQEVRPVETIKQKIEESHVNFWAPSAIMDEIKILSIRNKKSIKQLAIEAFIDLIEKHKNI